MNALEKFEKRAWRKTSDTVEVRGSPVHGRGGYALRDIKRDEKVIEYQGEKISKKESDKRLTEENGIDSTYVFELNKTWDIDGSDNGNEAQFINHSCNPNCETDIIGGKIWIIALRDIKKGEELVYDYNFDDSDYEETPCKCGSKNCRKFIIGEDYYKKILKKQKRKEAAAKRKQRKQKG